MEHSLWQKLVEEAPAYPPLNEDRQVEYLVVGGGIVGLVTAYLLQKAGKQVLLLEGERIGHGPSGRNTGKITCQHDLIYHTLMEQSPKLAADFYQANRLGKELLVSLIRELDIPCGLTRQESVLFTQRKEGISALDEEFDAYQKLGIPGYRTNGLPLPFPIQGALVMTGQYSYNPYAFLVGLAGAFTRLGGEIREGTRAVDLVKGEPILVKTDGGRTVSARWVVAATHFPFFDGGGMYFSRLEPSRSYLVALACDRVLPGSYITIDGSTPSIQYLDLPGGPLVLVGGADHPAGATDPQAYDKLRRWGREHLGADQIRYSWASQDLLPPDKLPYMGRLTPNSHQILVAAGFSKWGNTFGAAAGQILCDRMLKGRTAFDEVFSPARLSSVTNLQFVRENFAVAKSLLAGKLAPGQGDFPIQPGEGRVVALEGRKYGGYRDRKGKLYVVDITCPHMGCELVFNPLEATWDCPCHGSRFDYDGRVLEGPAVMELNRPGEGENPIEPNITAGR